MKTISVITPCYNEEEVLPETAARPRALGARGSLLNQPRRDRLCALSRTMCWLHIFRIALLASGLADHTLG